MLKLILLSVLGVMGLALPLTLILTAKENTPRYSKNNKDND